jgi:hypothetical protein
MSTREPQRTGQVPHAPVRLPHSLAEHPQYEHPEFFPEQIGSRALGFSM